AHGDDVVLSLRPDHGDAVAGHGHLHGGHVALAVLAHGGVAGDQLADPLVEVALLDPDHVGEAVAHLVHHVVGHVAVQGPVARLIGHELDGPGAPRRDQ